MLFYFAPIMGVTNYIYRNTFDSSFSGVDKYFTPFLVSNSEGKFSKKSLKDINRDNNNKEISLIPQLLVNDATLFNTLAQKLKDQGYDEVNLNLGCPSGTVTGKRRGSGFLKDPDSLKLFLDKIYNNPVMDISIKTRIGFSSSSEMQHLIPIFNSYPLKELIVHPRVREDFYTGPINLDVFKNTVEQSTNKVCYNGDLYTVNQINNITTLFPRVDTLMIGRGLIANPGLIEQYKTGKKMSIESFRAYHDKIFIQYSDILFGENHLLSKMKEHWLIWRMSFLNNSKQVKKLLKSQSIKSYSKLVEEIFLFNDMTI